MRQVNNGLISSLLIESPDDLVTVHQRLRNETRGVGEIALFLFHDTLHRIRRVTVSYDRACLDGSFEMVGIYSRQSTFQDVVEDLAFVGYQF